MSSCVQDAMETTAQSEDKAIAEELLHFFVDANEKEAFAAMLFTCYDLIQPDVALEVRPPYSDALVAIRYHLCACLGPHLRAAASVLQLVKGVEPLLTHHLLTTGGLATRPHGLRVPILDPVPAAILNQRRSVDGRPQGVWQPTTLLLLRDKRLHVAPPSCCAKAADSLCAWHCRRCWRHGRLQTRPTRPMQHRTMRTWAWRRSCSRRVLATLEARQVCCRCAAVTPACPADCACLLLL